MKTLSSRGLNVTAWIFVLLLLATGNTRGAPQQGIIYQAFPDGPTIEIDPGRPVVILDAHNVLTAKTCGDRNTLHCLSAGDFVFAYPRKGVKIGDKWEIGSHNFEVTRQVTREILGRKYPAYLIEDRFGAERSWHLFSPRFGLLAFGRQGESNSTFLVRDHCGYGSSAACQRPK